MILILLRPRVNVSTSICKFWACLCAFCMCFVHNLIMSYKNLLSLWSTPLTSLSLRVYLSNNNVLLGAWTHNKLGNPFRNIHFILDLVPFLFVFCSVKPSFKLTSLLFSFHCMFCIILCCSYIFCSYVTRSDTKKCNRAPMSWIPIPNLNLSKIWP